MVKNTTPIKKSWVLALSCLLLSFTQIKAEENIAHLADVTTSKVSGWESLAAVNDGFEPTASSDASHGRYGNWPSPGAYNWVQYEWPVECVINSVKIYWADDNDGLRIPDEAYIEYWEDGDWSPTQITVPTVINQYNQASLNGVSTKKIRVQMMNNMQSTGIIEFQVMAEPVDLTPPSAPGKPSVVSRANGTITVEYTPATDNVEVAGYDILLDDQVYGSSTNTTATISNLPESKLCLLKVRAKDANGSFGYSEGIWVYTGSEQEQLTSWEWPAYNPTIDQDFSEEIANLQMPTQDLTDCDNIEGTISDRWWSFVYGPNKREEITDAAVYPMLERLNTDFAYLRNEMGWPADRRNRNGYRSAVYLYGSGLCTDNADNTATGGWMGSTWYNGQSWPMILASYYPVYSFDPNCPYAQWDKNTQMYNMVHEGIHALFVSMPGCTSASWFHEAANTWLQQNMEAQRTSDYSTTGYLNTTTYLAPFMPIECYRGWLQDGSFGGPAIEGVYRTNNSGEVLCTWRNLLGGNQYGNSFPTFLAQTLGDGSIKWIWQNSTGRVLDAIGTGLGDKQVRKLIMEYRAKQALLDMQKWTGALKNALNSFAGTTITAENEPKWIDCDPWIATPYAKTTLDEATQILSPEYRTTPGWSGANQIPLNVTGSTVGETVIVDFMPIDENMTCQLCYRDTNGNPVYGKPVSAGKCGIKLETLPANNVVIAVITNTDYIYYGEETRTKHYDYRLKLVSGVAKTANTQKKWFYYDAPIVDDPVATSIEKTDDLNSNTITPRLLAYNVSDYQLVDLSEQENTVKIFSLTGTCVFTDTFNNSNYIVEADVLPSKGMYLLIVTSANQKFCYKILKK